MSKLNCEVSVADNLQNMLKKYVSKGNFCDVTLVSDDYQQFPAHKLMLAAHSPVLETLLLNCPSAESSHTVLHLRGYSGLQLQKLLQLVYHGEMSNNGLQDDDEFHKLFLELQIQLINGESIKQEHSLECNANDQKRELNKFKEDHKVLNSSNLTLALISNDTKKQNHNEIKIKMGEKEQHVMLGNEKDDHIILEKENDDMTLETIEYSVIDGKKTNYFKIIDDAEAKFECALCDEICNDKRSLSKHYSGTHDTETVDVKCKNCMKIFKHETTGKAIQRLKIHFLAFHGIQKYQCTECDFKAGARDPVYKHFGNNHPTQAFPCDECDYVVKGRMAKYQLILHKKRWHGMDGGIEAVKCEKCDIFLKGKIGLRHHMASKHTVQRLFACSRCPFKTSSKEYLKKHESGIHDGVKFKCQMCDYETNYYGPLKNHIRVTHEGLRFYCDECTSHFSQNGQLKKHMRIKHNRVFKKMRSRSNV